MAGEHKLWTLTYSWIASQAGVSPAHARNSAWRGEFEPRDLESVLRWVNVRRAARGLETIPGEIPATIAPNPSGGQTTQKSPENKAQTVPDDSHLPNCPEFPTMKPVQTTFNPETGEFHV
jgi:hypothetical protein